MILFYKGFYDGNVLVYTAATCYAFRSVAKLVADSAILSSFNKFFKNYCNFAFCFL